MANAGIVKELEDRGSAGGKPISAGELASLAQLARVKGPAAFGAKPDEARLALIQAIADRNILEFGLVDAPGQADAPEGVPA